MRLFKFEFKTVFSRLFLGLLLCASLAVPAHTELSASFYSFAVIDSATHSSSELIPLDVRYSFLDLSLGSIEISSDTEFSSIAPAVIGDALVYPNPLRMSEGGELGYDLSKPLDIELRLYDMMGHLIYSEFFLAGTNGGFAVNSGGYNKIPINTDTFSGTPLSAGVYFYLIIHEGKVLSKGKMAIVP